MFIVAGLYRRSSNIRSVIAMLLVMDPLLAAFSYHQFFGVSLAVMVSLSMHCLPPNIYQLQPGMIDIPSSILHQQSDGLRISWWLSPFQAAILNDDKRAKSRSPSAICSCESPKPSLVLWFLLKWCDR